MSQPSDEQTDSGSYTSDLAREKEEHPQDLETEAYTGPPGPGEQAPPGPTLSRRGSAASIMLERARTQYSFFNERLSSARWMIFKEFLKVYLILGTFVLAVFSIYWGSMYQRNSRIKNLRMLVVIEDQQVGDIPPLFSNTITEILHSKEGAYYGDWHIFSGEEFRKHIESFSDNVEDGIWREVHHQHYWSSFYIKPNATYNYYQAMIQGDTSYNVSNSSIVSFYETGRDFTTMNSYVTPSIKAIEEFWLASAPNVTSQLLALNQNSSSGASSGQVTPDSLHVIATPLRWTYYDRIPYTDAVLLAPSQVGLIYMIIITLFQVNFLSEVHQTVARLGIKPLHYSLYRFLTSVLSFFIVSLFFSLVTLAMQVDFTHAFGRSGFLVYWMFSFITMWAVGMANEIMVMLCVLFYPPLVGLWLLFWVLVNVSPTFTALALCPRFYRYGYAFPIHNSFEASKVVFFGVWKGQLGRNIGILFAWIVVLSMICPIVTRYFGKTMAARAKAAAAGGDGKPGDGPGR